MLLNFKQFKELYFALFVLCLIMFLGTIGFMSVEGYTVSEGLYMTIITVSTVGFQEVRPLTEEGRLFTSFLIISSFGTFAYAISSITRYVVSGDYRTYFKNYKVNQEIKNLHGHVIICGFGRNGSQAAKTLKNHKKDFVVVESDPQAIEEIKELGIKFVEGDAKDEGNLLQAGIERAHDLITTLPQDSENVFVVLTARELNRTLRIISRASDNSSEKKLRIAGADNVIMPDRVGGAHMASLVLTPDVIEFIDKISIGGANEINLEEIELKSMPDKFQDSSIREFESVHKTGCRIIGIKKEDGEYIVNPSPEYQLSRKIKLFVLGTVSQIGQLRALLS